MSTVSLVSSCWRILSRAMKVPVRPTPALSVRKTRQHSLSLPHSSWIPPYLTQNVLNLLYNELKDLQYTVYLYKMHMYTTSSLSVISIQTVYRSRIRCCSLAVYWRRSVVYFPLYEYNFPWKEKRYRHYKTVMGAPPAVHNSGSREGCSVDIIPHGSDKLNERLCDLWDAVIWPHCVVELTYDSGIAQMFLLWRAQLVNI